MKTAEDLPWLLEAFRYIGIREGAGNIDNPVVVKMYADAGHPEVKHDEVAWCAAFVGAVLKRCGLANSGSLMARSYDTYGKRLASPIVGCIATKARTGGGHVFFVVGIDKAHVLGLGGNQNDSVSVARFPIRDILQWRWPNGVPIPTETVLGIASTNAPSNVKET